MNGLLTRKPETMYLGYEKGKVLFIREGLFTEPVLINPLHKMYERLLNLLGEEVQVTFNRTDIEYKFLQEIYNEDKVEL